MFRTMIILLLTSTLLVSCSKSVEKEEDQIIGTWVREGTNGTGSGNTLLFSKTNGTYTLSFDCSGSPGPDWPSSASTEYKFQNGVLTYRDYSDNSHNFYTATSFKWITKGEEFEIWFRQVLLFMSAEYVVKYKKVG